MKRLIEQFLFYLAIERGLSTNYQLSTRRSLETFASWARDERSITSAGQVRREHLTEYLVWRKRSGLASASVKLEAVALRRFFGFLYVRNILPGDPAETLSIPRVEQRLVETLTVPDITRLFESVSTQSVSPEGPAGVGRGKWVRPPRGLRDRAILELSYASGLRASELCDVRIEDLDLKEGMIRVTGKGNKTRLVPVGSEACEAIGRYLELERPRLVRRHSGAEIFLSGGGRKGGGRKLTRALIWQLVKRYAARAGLGANVYPHVLLHSCATHLLTGGCYLRVIQEILGHADISTTQVYTHVDVSHLKAVHKKCHPRASFKTESQMLTDFLRRFPVHKEFHLPGDSGEASHPEARAA